MTDPEAPRRGPVRRRWVIGGPPAVVAVAAVAAAYHTDPAMPAFAVATGILAGVALTEMDRSLPLAVRVLVFAAGFGLLAWYAIDLDRDRILLRITVAAAAGLTTRVVVDAYVDRFLMGLASAVLGWTGWLAVLFGLSVAVVAGIYVKETTYVAEHRADRAVGPANVVLAVSTTTVLLVLAALA